MRRWSVPKARHLLSEYLPMNIVDTITLPYVNVDPKMNIDLPEEVVLNELLPFLPIDDAVGIQMNLLKPYEYPLQSIWLEVIRVHYPAAYQQILGYHQKYLDRGYDSFISTLKSVREYYIKAKVDDPALLKALLMAGLYAADEFLGLQNLDNDVSILYLRLSQIDYDTVMSRFGSYYATMTKYPVLLFLIEHGAAVTPEVYTKLAQLVQTHPVLSAEIEPLFTRFMES